VARLTGEASHLAGERDGLAAQLDESHGQADREREQLVAQLDEARVIIQGAADRLRELEAQQAAAEAEELEAARAEAALAVAALAEARQVAEAAEGQVAGMGAELQAIRWDKEEIEQKLAAVQQRELERAAERGGAAVEATRLRSELEALRAEAEPLQAELARLRGGQEVLDLEVDGLRTELARVQAELAERATSPALDVPADTLSRMVAEKAELAAAVADRDQRIARLQREVTDKTERLGRLASEVGELKAKGLGKIFR
jgi:chromosome segregation ATPase